MTDNSKDKDQDKADERRDALAKRVLKMPPKPKTAPKKDASPRKRGLPPKTKRE
jgi:hypothetical protein